MAERKLVAAVVEACERKLWGSLGAGYRRCGRPGCHCARGEKHGPVFYLTGGEHGHSRNIYVPEELGEEVEAGVAACRGYRELGTRRLPRPTRAAWGWARSAGAGNDHATPPPAQHL